MKPIIVLLNLFCLYQIHEARGSICPKNWVQDGDSSRCFYVSDDYATFDVAKQNCESLKSELVPVLTLERQLQLNSLLLPLRENCDEYGNCLEFWIGIRDLDGNNKWTTTKDIPIDQQHQFWAEEYPKNEGRCVLMSFEGNRINGVWENGFCERLLKYVCITSGCPSGFEYLPEAKGCFRVLTEKLNWGQATEACRSLVNGAHLAAITNAAKQIAIKNYLKPKFEGSSNCKAAKDIWWHKNLQAYWISGQRMDPNRCSSPFVWKILKENQIPFSYSNWIPGEPNCEVLESCVHIAAGYDYQWNDMGCEVHTCSLCEI